MNDVLRLPELSKEFLEILSEAQDSRPTKVIWIGNILEWVLYERSVMLDAVNSFRLKNGFEQVTLDDIEKVERQAVGHSDYSRKFSLYCAELAMNLQ